MDYPVESSIIRFYHAHIYYDADSRPAAARLREEIERRFEVVMGVGARSRSDPSAADVSGEVRSA